MRSLLLSLFVGITATLATTVLVPGNAAVGSRIVGGIATTIQQHPHQVSLEYQQEHYCGGVVIRRNVVLTGAHCFIVAEPQDYTSLYRVRVGTSVRNTGGQLARITEVVEHPSFNPATFNFDVAVVRLCDCLDYSESFYRMDLAPLGTAIPDGTLATLTGYGRLFSGGDWAPVLQAANLTVLNHAQCVAAYTDVNTVTTNQFCAGSWTGSVDSCTGDTGGPLVWNNQLIGLASWGVGCGLAGYPTVFTSIPVVRQWIDLQLV